MKIIVLAHDREWNELITSNVDVEWVRINEAPLFSNYLDANAFFNLDNEAWRADYSFSTKPIFINSVCHTLKEINAPENVIRINAWAGFINRAAWETAGNITENVKNVLTILNKKIIPVKDEPGFIAARIIAMIVNEAYFAKGDGVSTEAEIDIAMKLGTNYPFGPFEWGNKIGLKNICELLNNLALEDSRYKIAPVLIAESHK